VLKTGFVVGHVGAAFSGGRTARRRARAGRADSGPGRVGRRAALRRAPTPGHVLGSGHCPAGRRARRGQAAALALAAGALRACVGQRQLVLFPRTDAALALRARGLAGWACGRGASGAEGGAGHDPVHVRHAVGFSRPDLHRESLPHAVPAAVAGIPARAVAARWAIFLSGGGLASGRAAASLAAAPSTAAFLAAHARASALRGAGIARRAAHSIRGRVRHAVRGRPWRLRSRV
jgi:hypothetical protein